MYTQVPEFHHWWLAVCQRNFTTDGWLSALLMSISVLACTVSTYASASLSISWCSLALFLPVPSAPLTLCEFGGVSAFTSSTAPSRLQDPSWGAEPTTQTVSPGAGSQVTLKSHGRPEDAMAEGGGGQAICGVHGASGRSGTVTRNENRRNYKKLAIWVDH